MSNHNECIIIILQDKIMEMDRVKILENILNRGEVRLRVEDIIPGSAITYEYQDSSSLEEKITTFLEILEQEEKNEKWASGITTYQISKFKNYPANDGCLSIVSASSEQIIVKKNFEFCPVCLANINRREIIRELSCGHKFHKKCIDHWLKKKAVCPIDRKSMLSG